MTYTQVEEYINGIPKFTKKNKPDHTRQFMKLLGNPQEKFQVIHVAGSNGKGSVCAMVNSVLMQTGKVSGLFISPHLVKMTERFQINGQNATDQQFIQANEKVLQAVKALKEMDMPHPTFFEYLFGLGMVLFRDAGVQVAVLETGLGGRLDATNVVEHPILTIITSISLEHTEILGDTLGLIAGEKAGIIKNQVPILFCAKEPEVIQVIEEKARQMDAPLVPVKPEDYRMVQLSGEGVSFQMKVDSKEVEFQVPFPAAYQVENGSIAVKACLILSRSMGITLNQVKEGLRVTKWPGRMEPVGNGIYLDGAHNPDGMEQFLTTVKKIGGRKPVLLFSMVKEKDYPKVIKELVSEIDWGHIYVTQIHGPREIPAKELGEIFLEEGTAPVTVLENNKQAFQNAIDGKGNGTLFCTGSLYLIGELKKILEE